jgi:hypothetical protein
MMLSSLRHNCKPTKPFRLLLKNPSVSDQRSSWELEVHFSPFSHWSKQMHFVFLVLGLWASAVSSVTATALTYKLDANEKACFYAQVEQQNAKVAFYFAVSIQLQIYRLPVLSAAAFRVTELIQF